MNYGTSFMITYDNIFFSMDIQVAGEKDQQMIADVLSQHVGRLCPVTLSPYRNMLCCCEYSQDATFYRGRVKGEVCYYCEGVPSLFLINFAFPCQLE